MTGDERGQALLASIEAPWRAALQEGWVAFGLAHAEVNACAQLPPGRRRLRCIAVTEPSRA